MENRCARRSTDTHRIRYIAIALVCAVGGALGCADSAPAPAPAPSPTPYIPSFDRTWVDADKGDRFSFSSIADDTEGRSGELTGTRVAQLSDGDLAAPVALDGSFSDRDISFTEVVRGVTYTGRFMDDNTIRLRTSDQVDIDLQRIPPL